MQRSVQRRLSIFGLVLMLFTLWPATPGQSAVGARPVSDQPQRSLARSTVAEIPTPDAARSTDLPASYATDVLRPQYQATHTLTTVFDGSFNTEEVPTLTRGTYTATPGKPAYVDLPVGSRDHDLLTLDVEMSGTTFAANAAIAVQEIGGDWSKATPTTVLRLLYPSTSEKRTKVRLSLGVVPRGVPIQIRLACEHQRGSGSLSCLWSNLEFASAVPGWTRVAGGTTTAKGPYELVVGATQRAARSRLAALAPSSIAVDTPSPFLEFVAINAGSGGAYSQKVIFRSPLIQLPVFGTNEVTATVRWARVIRDSDPFQDTAGATIRFVPASTLLPADIVVVPTGDTTTSTGWQTVKNTAFLPTRLSGQRGWFEIDKPLGGTDHVLALDDLTLYRQGQPLTLPIPADQVVGKCDSDLAGATQCHEGDPVNTHAGAFYLQADDLIVSSNALPLIFSRTYVSLFATAAATNTVLGRGWRHSFEARLTLPTDPGGEPGTVIYEAPTGNRLRFLIDPFSRRLSPLPGIRATLDRLTEGSYRFTTRDQRIEQFTADGRLVAIRDLDGSTQTLTYYAADHVWAGQLKQVIDDATGRSLTFEYAPAATSGLLRLSAVRDSAQREVRYTVDSAGQLYTVTDLRGETTTYTYTDASRPFLLTSITDPGGARQLSNCYDGTGRVDRQEERDAAGNVHPTTYQYDRAPDGSQTTTITRLGLDGTLDTWADQYRQDGSIEYQTQNGKLVRYTTFDSSFAPAVSVDGAGHVSRQHTNTVGLPTAIVSATGITTTLTYDQWNQPTELVEPTGITTTLDYIVTTIDGSRSPRLHRTTRRAGDGLQLTTVYTYTTDQLLQEARSADGVVTRYTYDQQGQVTTITVGAGTSAAQTTRYAYDLLGRVTATITGAGTPLERRDETHYNPDGTVAWTMENVQDGRFEATAPDTDIRTTYGYDRLGRRIWVQDVLGRVDATHYDAWGRIDWRSQNLTPFQIDPTSPTGQLRLSPFDPRQPDRNVTTSYGYDALGRTTTITETGLLTGAFDAATRTFADTTTRVTRISYDVRHRPIRTVVNHRPSTAPGPDVNLETRAFYDGAGNLTWSRDALGRWTQTAYDLLSRPITTTVNYENGDPERISPGNTSWATPADTDLITVTRYRADGQVAQTIENYVDGRFTSTAPITDRITLYDYDALSRPLRTTFQYDPTTTGTRTDTNRTTSVSYDPRTGQVVGTRDAGGRWTHTAYDGLSRVTRTIANCRTHRNEAAPDACGAFNPAIPDRNVPATTRYDAAGRITETIDALGQVTRRTYDGLGRVTATIENVRDGVRPNADTNVTYRTSYDALGQITATLDPTGAVTRQSYNLLGQQVTTTDASGRATTYGYDGSGTLRWTLEPDGQRLTVVQVGGLGRPTATIQNYANGLADAHEPVDRDVISRTVYDAAGRVTETIDALGQVTAYSYDLRDRLVEVRENVRAGCTATDCNRVTRYRYDRLGNRTAIIDANGHQRTFGYDAAQQQILAEDALGYQTRWTYDALGRVQRHADPRGADFDRTYSYDEQDRRIATRARDLAITAGYDALGRRTRLSDGTGTTLFEHDALGRITAVLAPDPLATPNITTPPSTSATTVDASVPLALAFVSENVRQDAPVSFQADGLGGALSFTQQGVTLTLPPSSSDEVMPDPLVREQAVRRRHKMESAPADQPLLRLHFVGANPQPMLDASDILPGVVHDLRGADPAQWRTHLPTYRELTYHDLYPGIDLRYDGTNRHLKGTYTVAPGSNPARIRWRYHGTRTVQTDAQGNLQITLSPPASITLTDAAPIAWQEQNGSRLPVMVRYQLHADGSIGFSLGAYDRSRPLIIDPALTSSRWGGAGNDYGYAVAVDQSGHHYVAGSTTSHDHPANRAPLGPTGQHDAVVTKLDPSGTTVLWSTYLGGQGDDMAYGLALDAADNLYLTGSTRSTDFSTQHARQPTLQGGADAFVAALDPSGSALRWSTYLGGSDEDYALRLAVDPTGTVAVVGSTNSDTFPVAHATQPVLGGGSCGTPPEVSPCLDAFMTILSADGQELLASTYLGGVGDDQGTGIARTATGQIYLTGVTNSPSFPGTTTGQPAFGGIADAFVATVSANGQELLASAYVGGSQYDTGRDLALDAAGQVYVTGWTYSSDFPRVDGNAAQHAGQNDLFVVRLPADLQSLGYSRLVGGAGRDYGYALAVDAVGRTTVTGWTNSPQFPLVTPIQPQFGSASCDPGPAQEGCYDAVIVQLDPNGRDLAFSSYLGGSGDDYGLAVVPQSDGALVVSGSTASADFPTVGGLRWAGGGADSFVATIGVTSTPPLVTRYSYTPRGERASLTYPSGSSVRYRYTLDRQVQSVEEAGRVLAHYTYEATTGRLQHVIRANGTTTGYAYDQVDRITRLRTVRQEAIVSEFAYTVDRLGQRVTAVETLDGQTRTVRYAYDGLQRLVEATETPGTTYRYTYDLAGNRTEVWTNGVRTQHRQYNAANQVAGWHYDAAGNLLNDGTQTLHYDALNRLRSAVALNQSATSYTYNGDGILVAQARDGLATRYVQDVINPLSQILEARQGAAHTTYRYGRERLMVTAAASETWYTTDALRSVRQTLDQDGATLTTHHYDPWGAPEARRPAPSFGFTGELHDPATDLIYLRARWYHPQQATFTSRDPFAGKDTQPYSLHPYQYAYSNPALHTDPSGECLAWVKDAVRYAFGYPPREDCRYRGWSNPNWADGLPWFGGAVDVTPGAGDVKGLVEVFTGCDLVTGEDLGGWRYLGLLGLSEVRHLRHVRHLDLLEDGARRAPSGSRDTIGHEAPNNSRAFADDSARRGGGYSAKAAARIAARELAREQQKLAVNLATEFSKRVNGEQHFTIARAVWTDANGQQRVMLSVNDFYGKTFQEGHAPAVAWLKSQGIEVLGGRFTARNRDLHAEIHLREFFEEGQGNLAPGSMVSVGVSNVICRDCRRQGIVFEPNDLIMRLTDQSEIIFAGR